MIRRAFVAAAAAVSAAGAPAAAVSAAGAPPCPPPALGPWLLCERATPDASCVPATVPGTVLTALLANGTFAGVADPFVDNATALIPDIAATGPAFWTRYWVSSVIVDAACAAAPGILALVLPQVNYRAAVFVDGAEVLPLGTGGTRAAGMYQRHTFALGAVAPAAGSTRSLAVLVSPPDHPGNATNACEGCGQGGDHAIARDVTSQDVAGWDWIVGVPDRNTGLLDAPALVAAPSGLLLRDPVAAVVSMSLPPPGADGVAPRAAAAVLLRVRVGVLVLGGGAGAGNTSGLLELSVPSLAAGPLASVAVSFAPAQAGQWVDVAFPDVSLTDVPLWWPHTLGPPTLHAATITFAPAPPAPATALQWAMGVRSVSSELDATLGGRVFRVNGQRIFLQGGNYINADMFARFREDGSTRYRDEVRMHAAAGLNLLRLWGGSGGHPAALYEAADAQGVLVMAEFWMSGDNNGRWAGDYSWPLDHALYLAAARDTMLLLRSHASVLLFCGGNELYPLTRNPAPDIAAALPAMLGELYPVPPPYVQSSMGSTYSNPQRSPPVFDAHLTLAPMDGPYGFLDEREFGTRNPGLFYGSPPIRADTVPIAFQPELGSSACAEYESLARFLSAGPLAAFPPVNASYADPGVHPMWRYHAYLPFTDAAGWDHVFAYGAPTNTSEYAARAQLAQFVQSRAMFEGFQQFQWRFYGAMIMWKSQSPWPTFRGALYDSYLAAGGGFWGVRAATGGGAPLRVSLNTANYSLVVINKGMDSLYLDGCELSYAAYDIGTGAVVVPPASQLVTLSGRLPAGGVLNPLVSLVFPPSVPPGSTTLLYRVQLQDPSGATLASGDYWLASLSTDARVPQDLRTLGALRAAGPAVVLAATAVGALGTDGVLRVNVTLVAPADARQVAVGVRVTLRDPSHAVHAATGAVDDRVLPAWASHGYFCLVPGERLDVMIEADWPARPPPAPGALRVSVDGFTAQASQVVVDLASSVPASAEG